jgi:multidrug resistance efflux pump
VKRYSLIGLVVLIVLAGIMVLLSSSVPILAGGDVAVHALDEAQAAAAQDATEASTATEDVSPAAQQQDYVVVAEGIILPVQHATLSMAASGIVDEILVPEGGMAEAGEVILRLQSAHQRAAVAEAQAAIDAAQASLAALEAGSRVQEIVGAQATLDAAKARLARLREGARPEEIVAAEARLAAAQATLQRLYDGPDAHTKIAAEADLANAEAALRQAQAAYDQVAGRTDVAMLPQSLQLQQATNAYEAARARYDALFDDPKADLVSGARAQVKEAQANLDRLREPATENEIAEVEAMVQQAQAQYDLAVAGPRGEELAAAAAAVDQARAGLDQVQASLADTELRAPFAGTVAALEVSHGEQVVAGVPIVQLAQLGTWQVETDDLTELDVVRVEEGEPVTVTLDAIEGLELAGTVERIKAVGQEKLGDMTYTVIVRLDEQDPRLRWNMTAVVMIP